MILGIGVDVCDVARFESAGRRTPAMTERVLTGAERVLPVDSQAARFAAKEALAKALGAPPDLGWHDAEVVSDEAGRPSFVLRGTVRAAAEGIGVRRVHLSLSHDGGLATAFVVLEGEQPGAEAAPRREVTG
jgi:holo-[acyl-carrier protein] synthase